MDMKSISVCSDCEQYSIKPTESVAEFGRFFTQNMKGTIEFLELDELHQCPKDTFKVGGNDELFGCHFVRRKRTKSSTQAALRFHT